ncbi:hypothetical protein CLM82_25305, partial [Streptomyces albidoflavus]|uniref:hypothetical protein n=1 Tax=Streptomyces albidoflavus TaxID=1886 RepID=UPI000BC4D94E
MGGKTADEDAAAPVIEVSGRTYPVEVRDRPLREGGGEDADRDRAGRLRPTGSAGAWRGRPRTA